MLLKHPAVAPAVIDFSLAAERLLSRESCPALSDFEQKIVLHYAQELSTVPLPVRTVDVWGRRED